MTLVLLCLMVASRWSRAEEASTAGEKEVAAHFAAATTRCEGGDPGACRRLANRLHYPTNERELGRLTATLGKACAAGVPTACAGQGLVLARGVGVPADPKRGLVLLDKSCQQQVDFACAELAEIYLQEDLGTTGKRDSGAKLARESCEKLGGWPCFTVVGLSDTAPERKLVLIQRACDTGDPIACYELGMSVSAGEGVPKDDARATRLYQKACDADFAQACDNLAWQYERGTGAAKDERRARELFSLACKLGDSEACDYLAKKEDKPQLYCDLWGKEACFAMAEQAGKQHGETAETAEAILSAGNRACVRGHVGACNVLGHLAKDFIGQCDAGKDVRNACSFAGLLHAQGLRLPPMAGPGVAVDAPRAASEFRRACPAGATLACEKLKNPPPRAERP
jgi:TPR repeat protein